MHVSLLLMVAVLNSQLHENCHLGLLQSTSRKWPIAS